MILKRVFFYTVVGSSGSGKTTFLSLAGGLDTQKEGDIFYKGSSLKSIGLQQFRNKYVSIVFQSYNLLTYMTALQKCHNCNGNYPCQSTR